MRECVFVNENPYIYNSGWAEAIRLVHHHGPFPQQQQAIFQCLVLCWNTVREKMPLTKRFFLWDKLMNAPDRFLPAVPWVSPGWRTPAARCSSHPADPLPAGSSWRHARSYRSGGLLCGPAQSCTSGSSPICLWYQSEGREREQQTRLKMTWTYKHMEDFMLSSTSASHLYFTLVVAFAGFLLQLHAVQLCSQRRHGFLFVFQLGSFLLALCNHT